MLLPQSTCMLGTGFIGRCCGFCSQTLKGAVTGEAMSRLDGRRHPQAERFAPIAGCQLRQQNQSYSRTGASRLCKCSTVLVRDCRGGTMPSARTFSCDSGTCCALGPGIGRLLACRLATQSSSPGCVRLSVSSALALRRWCETGQPAGRGRHRSLSGTTPLARLTIRPCNRDDNASWAWQHQARARLSRSALAAATSIDGSWHYSSAGTCRGYKFCDMRK